ncbi:MAG: EpsI family protein [Candidatus Eisenbacteria sp.]|nr:EpsI family protein [Candidatus Eisenbacteria bacterium]
MSGWQAQDTPASAGVAQALAADVTLHRCFLRPDGSEVCLLVAYFAQQQVNSQIHSPRHCLPGGGWDVSSMQAATLVAAGAEQPATRMRIVRSGTAQDVYYWFSTQSGTVTDEYALKWNLVKNSLLGRPTNAAFVRYNAATADSTALREIFAHLQPALQAMLANVGLK